MIETDTFGNGSLTYLMCIKYLKFSVVGFCAQLLLKCVKYNVNEFYFSVWTNITDKTY